MIDMICFNIMLAVMMSYNRNRSGINYDHYYKVEIAVTVMA